MEPVLSVSSLVIGQTSVLKKKMREITVQKRKLCLMKITK